MKCAEELMNLKLLKTGDTYLKWCALNNVTYKLSDREAFYIKGTHKLYLNFKTASVLVSMQMMNWYWMVSTAVCLPIWYGRIRRIRI